MWLEFVWTSANVDHIAEHAISQDDFEYVVCNPSSKGLSHSSGLPAAWGYTRDGRYIMTVYEEVENTTILPVTAYEVPEPR